MPERKFLMAERSVGLPSSCIFANNAQNDIYSALFRLNLLVYRHLRSIDLAETRLFERHALDMCSTALRGNPVTWDRDEGAPSVPLRERRCSAKSG